MLSQIVGTRLQIQASSRPATERLKFAAECGPIECSTVLQGTALMSIIVFIVLEHIAYQKMSSIYDTDPRKHKATLLYVTICNLAITALLATMIYAVFP